MQPSTTSATPRYLLILGCSGRKRADAAPLSALERYDGVNYRVLRKARQGGYWPPTLDVLILSAKYGVLRADAPIPPYDQRMTRERALELRPAVARALDAALAETPYAEMFVNLGKTYRLALAGSTRLRAAGAPASETLFVLLVRTRLWMGLTRARDVIIDSAPSWRGATPMRTRPSDMPLRTTRARCCVAIGCTPCSVAGPACRCSSSSRAPTSTMLLSPGRC